MIMHNRQAGRSGTIAPLKSTGFNPDVIIHSIMQPLFTAV